MKLNGRWPLGKQVNDENKACMMCINEIGRMTKFRVQREGEMEILTAEAMTSL